MLTDKQLWESFLAGDNKSITSLYNRYRNDLFLYGLKIVGDESIVKDAIQDVFIKIIEKRQKLLIGDYIRLYLLKSIRNRLLDMTRSVSRKKRIFGDSYYVTEENNFSSVEDKIIQDESRIQVRKELKKVLNSLNSKQQEIIYLRYTQGLSYEEISELFEIDKASARTLLYRTIKIVRDRLENKSLFLLIITLPVFSFCNSLKK